MDPYLILARVFAIIAVILSAYLLACGFSALSYWIEKNLRK